MGFFDNLGKKASAAYDATAEKTNKIAKEAKLRMKMNENKSEINNIYKEIGKKVYEKHVRNENIDINRIRRRMHKNRCFDCRNRNMFEINIRTKREKTM